MSNYDQTYLDLGFGNRNGIKYGTKTTWRDIYKFSPRYPGIKVIGGETCMWGELSNVHTSEQKIWVRTSVLAERLWNENINIEFSLQDIAKRLTAQAGRMKQRGFKM